MAQDADKGKAKKTGLFDDLSMAQVVAGALAAVTSMLLASQIGIYGSVIGVGVGSVVSAVASQLYKKFLQRSADKLREIAPNEMLTGQQPRSEGGDARDRAAAGSGSAAGVGADVRTTSPDAAATSALPGSARRSRTPRVGDASLRGDTAVQQARAMRERKRKTTRRVVIVSAVSALVAVAVSAVVIYAVSAGEGVGSKTAPFASSSQSLAPAADDKKADESAGQESASKSGESSDDGSDAAGDASKDQDAQGSSGDQSDSGAGSDSGSSGSSGGSGGSGGSGDGSGSSGGSDSGSGSGTGGSGSGSGSGSGGDGGTSGSNRNDTGGDAGAGGSGSGAGSSGSSSNSSAAGGSASTSSGSAVTGVATTAGNAGLAGTAPTSAAS